ncbi:MAG: DUF1385 domain-containing protein [Clostridia bacterium]|nr:DUF1385 domain-containing protein [Clostridia bacterium]
MSKKTQCADSSCRLNRVGGQAVLEGVMMKAGSRTVTTCRREDGTLVVTDDSFVSVRKKYKILNLPILRGVINFVEMMMLSIKTLGASADAMGLEEEEPSKFEKWLAKKLGMSITDLVMIIGVVLGLGLSILLFLFLPIWITAGATALLGLIDVEVSPVLTAVMEGIVKVAVFIFYLALTALVPDIKRTFMYHGAEHKSIACFEAGDELTPESAMKHRRFHPRCGTSFMFFMILLGIFAGAIIKTTISGLDVWVYSLIRLLILPLLMGIGYEIIMLAGKHDNVITRAISAPGLWVQRITTIEPTLDMLEVAITSIKCALRDDFPEFMEFYLERSWETVTDSEENDDQSGKEGASYAKDDKLGAATHTDKAENTDTRVNLNGDPDNISYEKVTDGVDENAENSEGYREAADNKTDSLSVEIAEAVTELPHTSKDGEGAE